MNNAKQWMGAKTDHADQLNGPEAFLNEAALGPDAVLPTQAYGRRRGSAAMEPLRRLMMAILVDAIGCYQRNIEAVTLRRRREFREAHNWLFKDRNDGVFSFDTVCHVIDVDPDLLRQRLMQFHYARVVGVGRERMIRRRCA